MTTRSLTRAAALALCAALALPATAALTATVAAAAESGHVEIARQPWSFSGFRGQYDPGQLQRGFQVYKEVCSLCHGMKRLSFRNLVQPGGPQFPEEAVKALAAGWPNKIIDGPNDAGEMFERPAKLSDPILGPYRNDNQARAAQNGALPPDLSLMAKARTVEYTGPFWAHPFSMLRDIANSYQEGGPDYLYALLTGYTDPPEGFQLSEGMSYNKAFPGHQIAMGQPLGDQSVPYKKGPDGKPLVPETLDQHARDVTAFLAWAADPHLNSRKFIGWQVMHYLLVTTVLLYFGKKHIWSRIEH